MKISNLSFVLLIVALVASFFLNAMLILTAKQQQSQVKEPYSVQQTVTIEEPSYIDYQLHFDSNTPVLSVYYTLETAVLNKGHVELKTYNRGSFQDIKKAKCERYKEAQQYIYNLGLLREQSCK